MAETSPCRCRQILFWRCMASSLLSPASTAQLVKATACTSMPSTWSCDEGAKHARSSTSGRGHPRRASGSGVATSGPPAHAWMNRCLKNSPVVTRRPFEGAKAWPDVKGNSIPAGTSSRSNARVAPLKFPRRSACATPNSANSDSGIFLNGLSSRPLRCKNAHGASPCFDVSVFTTRTVAGAAGRLLGAPGAAGSRSWPVPVPVDGCARRSRLAAMARVPAGCARRSRQAS